MKRLPAFRRSAAPLKRILCRRDAVRVGTDRDRCGPGFRATEEGALAPTICIHRPFRVAVCHIISFNESGDRGSSQTSAIEVILVLQSGVNMPPWDREVSWRCHERMLHTYLYDYIKQASSLRVRWYRAIAQAAALPQIEDPAASGRVFVMSSAYLMWMTGSSNPLDS